MFSNDADYRISDRISLLSGRTTPVYIKLSTRTDRHQFMLQSSAADALSILVAHPSAGDGPGLVFPDADALAATEWVKPPGYTTNTMAGKQAYTVSFYGKYAALTMPGGGLTADMTIVYRPVPPTSP